jgi:hypothetical protein
MLWKPPRYVAGLWVGVTLVAFPLVYLLVYMATGRFPKGGPLSGGRLSSINDVIRDMQGFILQPRGSRYE